MIKIEVEGYCQSCLDFSPDVTKPERLWTCENNSHEYVRGDTIIRCEHRRRCAGIRRHLELQMKGENIQ